ncbi:MAG: PLP-dependent aminotransferase family protein [Treponemataceae bacterium]|nr:PLP-dependent aminotransferase family protein [Treponemataceae bacterium]
MITCDFQLRGNMSLCEYLYKTIKELITGDKIKKNEKLPSKRSLASHLGVSVITVANAYARLISEGYMYSVEKKGFFATADYIDVPEASQRKSLLQESAGLQSDFSPAKEKGLERKKVFADLRTNSVNYQKFPFSVWNSCMRDVLKAPHESLLKSPPPEGVFELREEIARYLSCFRDIDISPSQIVIGAGSEYISFISVSLFGRNAVYCVENPGYRKISSVFKMNGAKCLPIDVDGDGIKVNQVRQLGGSVVHVSPSHHFPTGTVMSLSRREELLTWASEREDRFIIEDDYDSEFRFTGQPLETLFGSSCKEGQKGAGHVLYTNTFSKTLSPSYRISYMVLPPSLIELFRSRASFMSCPVSVFEQYALSRFMSSGAYEKHIIRMKNYYRNLRNSLVQAINSSAFAEKCSIREENAGLHFLLDFKLPVSGKTLQEGFFENGLDIPLLSEYYQAKKSPDDDKALFVINYSGISRESIQETVARMASAVKNFL